MLGVGQAMGGRAEGCAAATIGAAGRTKSRRPIGPPRPKRSTGTATTAFGNARLA
jgi:hypothetical protein